MFRNLLAIAFLTSALLVRAQTGGAPLVGRVEGRTYVSPTGAYKVAIPVLPELGGQIKDTPNVVTFQDDFNVHVSIATFPQDATQRWELSTRGKQEYLIYFFSNFIMPDFKQRVQGVQVESVEYMPKKLDGVLCVYLLLPGGSMFANRTSALAETDHPAVAKRGNFVFVHDDDIYVISTELAERVTEGSAYKKTPTEENQLLRQRLDDLVAKMQFLKDAKNTSAASAPAPTYTPPPAK